MRSEEHSAQAVADFFEAIEPVKSAYADPILSYLVHADGQSTGLIAAQLVLDPLARREPVRIIECQGYYGFKGQLSALGGGCRELIDGILRNRLPAPDRSFLLSGAEARAALPYHFGQSHADQDQHVLQLMIVGMGMHRGVEDPWTFRSSPTPYSDLNDLLADLGLGQGNRYQLNIAALPPLVIDPSSAVAGKRATLRVLTSSSLARERVSLGLVVRDRTRVIERLRITGEKLRWMMYADRVDVAVGEIEIDVPPATYIECFAGYGAKTYHRYWVTDRNARINARLSVFELYDPDLEALAGFLSQTAKGGKTMLHEAAVASLLWILGFSPIHLAIEKDAPDVIAVSADGHVLVIDCTLSDLKTDSKQQKLLDRTSNVRAALERSDVKSTVCVPVIVTPRLREEILPDVENYEARGIVVFTGDDVKPLIATAQVNSDSRFRFAEIRARLERGIEEHKEGLRQQEKVMKDLDEIKRSLQGNRRELFR